GRRDVRVVTGELAPRARLDFATTRDLGLQHDFFGPDTLHSRRRRRAVGRMWRLHAHDDKTRFRLVTREPIHRGVAHHVALITRTSRKTRRVGLRLRDAVAVPPRVVQQKTALETGP